MANMTKAKEYEKATVLKNHPRSFDLSIRWSAQHELVEEIMSTDTYDTIPGIDEVRSAIAHSYRIKAQSFASSMMYSKAGIKKTVGTNLSDTMFQLEDSDLRSIIDAVIDWKYDCKTPADGSAKQAVTAEKYLASLDQEALEALLLKYKK